MEIRVEQGTAEVYPCELMLLFAFESPEEFIGPVRAADIAWRGFISALMKQGDFKGELHERRLVYTQGALPAKRILLTGLGKKSEFDLEKWREASSKAGQYIKEAGFRQFAVAVQNLDRFSETELAEAFVVGLLLGTYQFNEFKTLEREKIKEISEVVLLADPAEAIRPLQ